MFFGEGGGGHQQCRIKHTGGGPWGKNRQAKIKEGGCKSRPHFKIALFPYVYVYPVIFTGTSALLGEPVCVWGGGGVWFGGTDCGDGGRKVSTQRKHACVCRSYV